MGDRFYKRRKERFFTKNVENATSNDIILKMWTSCKSLFTKLGYDADNEEIQLFLQKIKEQTNEILIYWKDIDVRTFMKEQKRRPHLFELIRYKKSYLIEKGFPSNFINELEFIINELGLSYGTLLTEEDMKKIIMVAKYINDPDRPDAIVKLSLEDYEMFREERKGKRR